MVFWRGILGITGTTRCCNGLWTFLIIKARGRTAIELEHERNVATAKAIELLPRGSELLEYEPDGRLRVIRMYGPAAAEDAYHKETLPRARDEIHR
jgi:hypothetical protein